MYTLQDNKTPPLLLHMIEGVMFAASIASVMDKVVHHSVKRWAEEGRIMSQLPQSCRSFITLLYDRTDLIVVLC